MIYFAGSNNLSANMAESIRSLINLRSMDRFGPENGPNVLAYFEGASLTAPSQYVDFTDDNFTRHVISEEDLIDAEYVRANGTNIRNEEFSGPVQSIVSFVHWCMRKRGSVADKYAFIFSGHSFGFYGTRFLPTEDKGRFMPVDSIRTALDAVRGELLPVGTALQDIEAGQDSRRIPIVGFDSCNMGMVEIAYELKEVASVLIASPGNVPNGGWDYPSLIKHFGQLSTMEPSEVELDAATTIAYGSGTLGDSVEKTRSAEITRVARSLVKEIVGQQHRVAFGGGSIDVAALDLKHVDGVANSLGGLGSTLSKMLGLKSLVQESDISVRDAVTHSQLKPLLSKVRLDCQSYMH